MNKAIIVVIAGLLVSNVQSAQVGPRPKTIVDRAKYVLQDIGSHVKAVGDALKTKSIQGAKERLQVRKGEAVLKRESTHGDAVAMRDIYGSGTYRDALTGQDSTLAKLVNKGAKSKSLTSDNIQAYVPAIKQAIISNPKISDKTRIVVGTKVYSKNQLLNKLEQHLKDSQASLSTTQAPTQIYKPQPPQTHTVYTPQQAPVVHQPQVASPQMPVVKPSVVHIEKLFSNDAVGAAAAIKAKVGFGTTVTTENLLHTKNLVAQVAKLPDGTMVNLGKNDGTYTKEAILKDSKKNIAAFEAEAKNGKIRAGGAKAAGIPSTNAAQQSVNYKTILGINPNLKTVPEYSFLTKDAYIASTPNNNIKNPFQSAQPITEASSEDRTKTVATLKKMQESIGGNKSGFIDMGNPAASPLSNGAAIARLQGWIDKISAIH